ncbi:hypothetical protein [Chryseobacterium sp. S90]|uniref:hypothetical protein n=1 Tax=Chryseobacterium sp. S90 TaxID=3395373 RepID=UPI0039BD9258
MKKRSAFLCILVCSLTAAQAQTNVSQPKKANSKENKSKVAPNPSGKKHEEDAIPITINPIKSITNNIENVSGDQYSFKGFGTSNGPAIILHSSNGTSAAPSDLVPNDVIGSIYFSPRTAGTLNISTGSSINSYYRGNGTTLLSDLIFRTSNGERLRINPIGNIGIGTTTPNHLLDLGPYIATTPSDILGKKFAVYNNPAGTDFYGLGVNSGILQFHAGSAPTISPGMVLSSSGKVGIRTTTPNNILDLGYEIGSSPNDVLGKKLAIYNNTAGTSFYGLGVSSAILQFHAGSAADKAPAMVLNSSGKVGIGTNTPNNILDLGPYLGTSATDVLSKKLAVYNNAQGTDFYGLGSSTDLLQFHAGSTAAKSPGMVLSSSGKVGIGTTTPTNILDLGTDLGSTSNDVLGKKMAVYNSPGGTNFYGLGVSSAILQFHAGSAKDKDPAMVLSSAGNLGIGTTSPKKTMDIEGTARISQTVADNIPNRLMGGLMNPFMPALQMELFVMLPMVIQESLEDIDLEEML